MFRRLAMKKPMPVVSTRRAPKPMVAIKSRKGAIAWANLKIGEASADGFRRWPVGILQAVVVTLWSLLLIDILLGRGS